MPGRDPTVVPVRCQGMLTAMKYSMCKTPEDLLNALPQIKPLDRWQFLTDVGGGVNRFNKESFRGLPKFQWDELYNLPEVEENLENERKAAKQAKKDAEWNEAQAARKQLEAVVL